MLPPSRPGVAVLALLSTAQLSLASWFCTTQSQPNPIAKDYPNTPTGTINGTVAIIPIPYSVARQAVPSQYAILQDAYRSVFPDLPKDMYPAMLQSVLDHDIRSGSTRIPDFSRSSISFPFVDRLGDGYTSFAYGDRILVSITNLIALIGTGAYGNMVTGASFEPPCDAYACVPGTDCKTTSFAAYNTLQPGAGPKINHTFTVTDKSPYSIEQYKNITNQPQFSNIRLWCDNYIRTFNSSVSKAPYNPTFVQGTVSVVKPFFPKTTTFTDVWGLQIDNAFIENNYRNCQSLQGYTYSE